MKIMPSRLDGIRDAVMGYRETGVPLVSWDGTALGSAGAGSDAGMFYFVPRISIAFDLEPALASSAFLLAVLLTAVFTGCVGSALLFRRRLSRVLAFIALAAIGVVSFLVGDQYVIAPAVTIAIVPWFLYLYRKPVSDRALAMIVFVAGVAIGIANVTRAHAGTPVALFIATMLLVSAGRPMVRRCLLLLPLVAGTMAAPLYFHRLVERRDTYLTERRPGYVTVPAAHPFWHSVYIGFSYLNNAHVPAYRDEVAIARVEALAPGTAYVSREYERVLRGEVLRLAGDYPLFVAATLFAKLGKIAFYFLLFANVGLVAAFRRPQARPLAAAFWIALAFGSLQGLLVAPWASYLSGFIAFAALYGVINLNALIEAEPSVRLRDVLPFNRRTITA